MPVVRSLNQRVTPRAIPRTCGGREEGDKKVPFLVVLGMVLEFTCVLKIRVILVLEHRNSAPKIQKNTEN